MSDASQSSSAANEVDRRAYLSVAVSFGDQDALRKWGANAFALDCPECGAKGRLLGGRGTELRLEGFSALTKGGSRAILARCHACQESVTLPY